MSSEKFQELVKDFGRAVRRLEEVMRQRRNEFIRDSAIQRFEFTYELAWKALKAGLQTKGIQEYAPRDVFRSAFQAGLIDENPRWLKMVDTRNETTHIYKEAMAESVYRKLKGYLPLFRSLLTRLKKEI